MIELRELDLVFMFAVFAFALWQTWNKAGAIGYNQGYEDACVDVAHGNIKVTLVDSEDSDDYS